MHKRESLRIKSSLLIGAALLAALCFVPAAFAHEGSVSFSKITVDGSRVLVQLTINLLDLGRGLQVDIKDAVQAITTNYKVEAPELPAVKTVRQYSFITGNTVLFDLVYAFDHPVTNLKISSTLDRITQSGHSHILQIGVGDDTREAVLDATNPSLEIGFEGRPFYETAWDFMKLGVEHIFTGYDHLAFLAGLLLMTSTLSSLLKVVTSFTLAHTITLALATFELVSIPSRVIESLIALSIAYVAIENFTGKTLVHRWKMTFLFGLVHGFGFSNVLQEMELTKRDLALSLFSFNGGVEIGQLVFVSALFPMVYYATRSRWKRRFLSAASLSIMCLGFYWFIERALVVSG
ncbi:MAG: HupE/UreJ family protein [Acidobacteria bacterium]|nr:HupE/UreJ family protein [Acidobacteriota bacterium]